VRASALLLSIAGLLCAAPVAGAQAVSGGTDPDAPVAAAPAEPTPAPPTTTTTGGQTYGEANPATTVVATGPQATILPNGLAAAPESAPQEVKDAIAAANAIVGKPYVYGGGHNAKFLSRGYDCSGTVSYLLHGGDLLKAPLDSGSFMTWGAAGAGTWFTIYTNPGHAFAIVAGLRLDTSAAGDPSGGKGPRWRPTLRTTKGFKARHPVGW
jgi:cell wall-associated NlpC family hydrolase